MEGQIKHPFSDKLIQWFGNLYVTASPTIQRMEILEKSKLLTDKAELLAWRIFMVCSKMWEVLYSTINAA